MLPNKPSQQSPSQHIETPPCARCEQVRPGETPNPRAVSVSGKVLGYCRQCTRDYQNDRNKALSLVRPGAVAYIKANPTPELINQLQWAVDFLQPKKRGRPQGSNMCPMCKTYPRRPGKSYCDGCDKAYRHRRRKIEDLEASRYEALKLAESFATAEREAKLEKFQPYGRSASIDPRLIPPKEVAEVVEEVEVVIDTEEADDEETIWANQIEEEQKAIQQLMGGGLLGRPESNGRGSSETDSNARVARYDRFAALDEALDEEGRNES